MADLGFTASEAPSAPEASPPEAVELDFSAQKKLVLRMERKGRGGKTVTVLSQLRTDEAGREQAARELRRALGCGARVEGDEVVLQGDVRDRAKAWLLKRGVAKIVG